MDDIVMQAGWYSIFYGLDLFNRYLYLAGAVRKAKVHLRTDVWLPAQLLTKFIALFK